MGFLQDAGSFLFGGAANPPQAANATLTPGTQGAINQVNSNANESPDQIQNELMQGVAGTGKGLLKSNSDISADESALGMTSSDSQKQALADRSNRIYGNELSQTQREAPMQAAQMQMQRLQQAQGVLQARDKFNMSVANSQINNLVDANAARQQVLGEVVGMIGAGAGMAAGGGMAGARAGSSARHGMSGYKPAKQSVSTDYSDATDAYVSSLGE